MNTVDTYTNQVSNVWQCPIEVSAVIMMKRKEVRCVSNFKKFQILSVTSGTQNQELYHTSLHEPSELRIIDPRSIFVWCNKLFKIQTIEDTDNRHIG